MVVRIGALAALGLAVTTAGAGAEPPPVAARHPVTDTYHGVEVVDDYRWLEDWNDPKVRAWSAAENASARAYLDALPDMPGIRARVGEIMRAPSVRYPDLHAAGKNLLAVRRDSRRQQPTLVAFDNLEGQGEPRTVLDPEALSGGAAIDWFVPSPDGTLVAVSVSRGGSESGDVHVLRVADGQRAAEVVPGVNGGTAGGSLAWAPDGKGFYYTRYPRAGERPEEDLAFYVQVYFHALGADPAGDRYEVGKDFPRIAEIGLESDAAGRVLASVQKGDGGEFVHLLREPAGGRWTGLDRYEDRVVQAVLGPAGDGAGAESAVYMVSRLGAPRGRLLRLDLKTADGAAPKITDAKVVVPEQADTLVSEFMQASNLCITGSRIYAVYQLGGPSEVRVFDHDGHALPRPDQPEIASAGGLAGLGGDRVAFAASSYVQPTTWYLCEPSAGGRGSVRRMESLSTRSTVDFSPYEVVRETAASKDGTKVPVNIVRARGLTLDGSHPCLVTGYGGYGVNIEPSFSAVEKALLEQGFVLAVANIRGGGEFGEAWHRAGNLENKQNVFDDFAAACRHMIERKYTGPKKLAIEGGSNGGLLMGATLTQHPDLIACVVSHVGIYDMLRVELSPNGAFNIPEFGTVKDETLFKAMYAYSPYHRVRDGVAYPPTLFLTGENDPRVDPMQSRKMTARLQAAIEGVKGAGPILLRTSSDTGHGMGTPLDERIAQQADVDAFVMKSLGVEWRAVGR